MIAELIKNMGVTSSVDRFGLVELNAEDEQVLLIASEKVKSELGLVEIATTATTVVLGEKDQVLMMKFGL